MYAAHDHLDENICRVLLCEYWNENKTQLEHGEPLKRCKVLRTDRGLLNNNHSLHRVRLTQYI